MSSSTQTRMRWQNDRHHHPRWLDIERDRMIREADVIHAPQADLNADRMRAEAEMPAALRLLVIAASVCALVVLCAIDPLGRYAAARWQEDQSCHSSACGPAEMVTP